MITKYANTKIHRFIRTFVESKGGELIDKSDEIFTVKYPNSIGLREYTYQPTVSREKKIPLITTGSPAFQEIVRECLENGVLCQVLLKFRGSEESLLKIYFKDSPFVCENCDKVTMEKEDLGFCVKSPPCHHSINNAKIVSLRFIENEQIRFFEFYFSAIFQNKLRPRNEEIMKILIDEEGNVIGAGDFHEQLLLDDKIFEFQDFAGDLETKIFDKLKIVADEKLDSILKEKLAFYDLSLRRHIKTKLRTFDKRLKEERREKIISKKRDFDERKWQANHDILLKREEESFRTNIAVKFLNVLVINTRKISFRLNLDNNSIIQSSFILGVNSPSQVVCPECGKIFFEGYATSDSRYLCRDCIRQSIETGKIYSPKQDLTIDSTLNEFIEPDSGFICSVCGMRKSHLLEFKCCHDNSRICIIHYGLCEVCGNVFSEMNLVPSKESNRRLCPKHTTKCENCGSIIGVDEGNICTATGKKLCSCTSFKKCSSCQQVYSSTSLVEDKCPACNNLNDSVDQSLILAVVNSDSSKGKTTKWLVGKNARNSVIVSRGVFSNMLYVVENGKVTFRKTISFFDKLRRH